MNNFENYLIGKIIEIFSFDYNDSLRILNILKSKGIVKKEMGTEKEADALLQQEIKNFLMPKAFSRFKKYSELELNKLGVQLLFLRDKNDGWGTKLYIDNVSGIVWEDAPGRYTNEGFQISSE